MVAQLDRDQLKLRPLKAYTRLVSYALFEGRPLTTRGQWINPLLLSAFRLLKRLPQLHQVEKPVFILGTGRSGTTILGVVLGMHRQVGFLNEPKALWHAVYPHEDLIGSYSRGEASYPLNAGQADAAVRRAAHRLYGAYLRTAGARRVVDKYPEMIFRLPFLQAIFPDAKFIFLVRDGWDTLHSIATWSTHFGEQVSGELHDWWGADNRKWQLLCRDLVLPDPAYAGLVPHLDDIRAHRDMAAVEWIVTMRAGLHAGRTLGLPLFELRYEELVSAPTQALPRLLEYCELPPDPVMLAYAARVLHPVPVKPPVSLHPAVLPLFTETMAMLGYRESAA